MRRQMLMLNIRHAARTLIHSPVFSLAAIASLTIGIGANTAIFTAANTLLLAPTAGIANMDRLVDIGRTRPNEPFDTLSFATYQDVASRTDVFEGVYAMRLEPQAASVGGADGAERAWVEQVSTSYFDVLGVRPAMGRVFRSGDEQIGVPLRHVVLSHAYWQRRFAGDTGVVGRELLVNGDPFSVIGVAGEGFRGTSILAPDFWVPMTSHARGLSTEELLRSRGANWLMMGARLRSGVTLEQARQAMSAVAQQLAAQYPEVYRSGTGFAVLQASRVPGFGPTYVAPFFGLLMGLVGLVLLVACANLAGLLLARATSRSREIGIRMALGASRGSLIALLTTESLLLFAAGSLAAIGLSRLMLNALTSLLSSLPFPVHLDMPLDWRVLAFTGGLALITGTLTGLIPAWRSARADLLTEIKAANATPRRQRLRQVFVAAQLACCLVLTAVAGLLLRALDRAHEIDPGMQVDGIQVATFDLALAGYRQDSFSDVTDRLAERLRALPGIERVAAAQMTPLDGGGLGLGALRPEGGDPADRIDADWNVITPDFLVTLGIPVLQGRSFTTADRDGTPAVAIVNERFAAIAWPGQNPVGRRLENGDFRPGREQSIRRLTVVGVARDSKYRWIGEAPRAFIYVPLAQQADRRVHFFLRDAQGAPADRPLHAIVRAALKEFDPNLPLVQLMPLRDYANVSLLPQRLAASVAGSLGAVALLLSALGVYGVTAYAVASRTREIGIRIALGADRRGVISLLLRRVVTLTAIASAIGLAAALGAAQLMSGLLMGVSTVDPVAFIGTSMLLAITALAATIGPALRAASIDPVRALKNE